MMGFYFFCNRINNYRTAIKHDIMFPIWEAIMLHEELGIAFDVQQILKNIEKRIIEQMRMFFKQTPYTDSGFRQHYDEFVITIPVDDKALHKEITIKYFWLDFIDKKSYERNSNHITYYNSSTVDEIHLTIISMRRITSIGKSNEARR